MDWLKRLLGAQSHLAPPTDLAEWLTTEGYKATASVNKRVYSAAGQWLDTAVSIVDVASDVAKFLLARGPFAFLDTGWVGCAPDEGVEGGGHNQTYVWPAEFDVDYGEPTGLCVQTTPGVFVRHWTKATVSHDCSSGRSSIAMKTAAARPEVQSERTVTH